MVVRHEKIVKLRRVHLLGSFQSHIGNFDKGDDHWMMNQVHVMLLWAENLELISHWYVILNDDLDYFFGKLCNYNRCKKMRSTIFREWCDDAVLNSSTG